MADEVLPDTSKQQKPHRLPAQKARHNTHRSAESLPGYLFEQDRIHNVPPVKASLRQLIVIMKIMVQERIMM